MNKAIFDIIILLLDMIKDTDDKQARDARIERLVETLSQYEE